ncbi:hypothetical protein QT969_24560 [Rhodococcus sp. CSLK01-03]|uniref:Uncharacterized protein n=1 Tax=Rhodococcus indonesiensis TaxID=3055869 RepID=A0ABT7RW28_9NOCA|nr:hypothetical protein [Rhodococcus indonesiensis]MDM7491459.1 hypothetical protein [Rhodococcus indonesiensis]
MSDMEPDPIRRWLIKHGDQLHGDLREALFLFPIALCIAIAMIIYWGG